MKKTESVPIKTLSLPLKKLVGQDDADEQDTTPPSYGLTLFQRKEKKDQPLPPTHSVKLGCH